MGCKRASPVLHTYLTMLQMRLKLASNLPHTCLERASIVPQTCVNRTSTVLQRQPKRAIEVFEAMQRQGLVSNVITYGGLVSALEKGK